MHLVDEEHGRPAGHGGPGAPASSTARTSLTPAVTADSSTKPGVGLPRHDGRRASSCPSRAAPRATPTSAARRAASRRSGDPGASRCDWPTTSSSVRGRIRTASGCPARSASAAAASGGRRCPDEAAEQVLTRLGFLPPVVSRARPATTALPYDGGCRRGPSVGRSDEPARPGRVVRAADEDAELVTGLLGPCGSS